MKQLKYIGLTLFLGGLIVFTLLVFSGNFRLTEELMRSNLSEMELTNLGERMSAEIVDKNYTSPVSFGNAVIQIYNETNQQFRNAQQWDRVMYTPPKEFALKLARVASTGWIPAHKALLFFLTFGLGIIGALLFVLTELKLGGPAGIKNNGIYQRAATNRGWVGISTFIFLVSFYVLLYYFPYALVNCTLAVDPVKHLFNPADTASQWFLYGFLYCVVMTVMGVRMIIKYRHNNYQVVRTVVVVFFQLIFAFLLIEILPLFDLPARDLKNAWPLDYTFLFEWNVQQLLDSGHFGKFLFAWGIVLSLVIVPVMVYFYGKRWYCSWVCGCGGLAETLGDPYRQLSSKKLSAWKLERWLIHGVLVFAIIMTFFTGYLTYNVINNPDMESKEYLVGISAYDVRELYGFLIGSVFAGIIGTGFYPIFGNRTWCRFGCPLAAYMGLVQRFKSRFRITTNGGQCISCGNCSTYCEQGIDVRAYAQKGQNIVRSSCVGCGVCAAVCPRGVLKLENGPEQNRFGNEGPIVLGNNGFEIQN
ncbi:MAG: 4Fe-4S binding protein [Bacteroidetes bacterium]|nr:4Fe-4S binding protein [Bacteroidota bacterium]